MNEQTPQKKWYILHVYTQHEDKVKAHLEREISKNNLEEYIFDIVVPTEEVVEVRNNKKCIKKRKFFPGYILINMILDDRMYWIVKNTPSVTGFLGGLNPTALPDAEAERLIHAMAAPEGAKPKPAITFEREEKVRIIEGPFANFVGVVEDINDEKGKLQVMVTIFGRATPVELDFLQVEKI